MTILIALLMALATPSEAYAAVAIATCESGNTVDFGTYDWSARSYTDDGGAFQFNDATWNWLTNRKHADKASPGLQVTQFIRLWENGEGASHWSSSQACWSKWLTDNGRPVNLNHYDTFVWLYLMTQTKEQTRW
jgi:hypothetical protein